MVVVFGFYNCDRDIRFVIEDIIGTLVLVPHHRFTPNDDAALGKGDFFANLGLQIPSRLNEGRRDELGADVPFAEGITVNLGSHVYRF